MNHGVNQSKTADKSGAAPYVQYSEVEGLEKPARCYKPFIHRTQSFTFFLVLTLALIGVVEYASRTLPHSEGWHALEAVAESHLQGREILNARQSKVGSANPNAYLKTALETSTAPGAEPPAAYLQSTTAFSTNPSAYLNSLTRTTNPSAYLQSTIAPTTNPNAYLQSGTSATNPSAYLQSTIAPTTNPSAYLQPGTSATNPSAYLQSTTAPTTNPSAYLESRTSATHPSVYLDPSASLSAPASSSVSAYLYPGFTSAPSVGYDFSNTGDQTTVGAEPTSAYLNPAVAITSSSTTSKSRTTSSYKPSTTTYAPSPALEPSTGQHPPLKNLTSAKYFVGAYLPTLLAVIFRLSVGSLYAATKMLEPFFSLARAEGATVKNFFHINYLSTNDTFDPIKAMFSGHWLMLWTSVLYTAVGMMTPFASELLHFARFCDAQNVCGPELRVNPDIGRILQGLLAFAAVMLINVWWLQRKHSSGIYSDPSSIASLASLLHHPEVLTDFQRIHPDASKDDMLKAVKGKRYRLDAYRAADGSERYGLVPLGGTSYEQDKVHEPFLGQNLDPACQEQPAKQHHVKRTIRDVVFGLVTAGMLILVAYYYKVGSDSGFERFMDSQSFGPRFLFALVGMLIHSQWKCLERESAIIEPFRHLHAGPSPPRRSILIPRTLTPFTTLPAALLRGNFFVAHTAFVAVLAEVLIIVLAGIPFSAGQLHTAFVASAYLCISILAYMIVALLSILTRPKGPQLPRTPNTLGSVWSYLCGSRMVGDFADLACLETERRNKVVEGMGAMYELRRERGTDGVMRWVVDYDGDGRNGI